MFLALMSLHDLKRIGLIENRTINVRSDLGSWPVHNFVLFGLVYFIMQDLLITLLTFVMVQCCSLYGISL